MARMIFEIGDWVQSSHPITVLNPDKYFQVEDVRITCGKVSYRGEKTCWFSEGMITEGHVAENYNNQ